MGLGLAVFAMPAYAQNLPDLDSNPVQSSETGRDTGLDRLFDELKAAPTEDDAERLANKIDRQFRQSGSDTLDLMLNRAREAIGKGDVPVAIEILSRVIALQPDWAEAWNVRATAFFLLGDQERSKADIVATLAREPRHFGALTGLAVIFEMQDRKKDALKVYRQVQALAPRLKPITSAVERLTKEIEQPM